MSCLTRWSRRWPSALLAAAALLTCAFSHATCEVRVPGVSVNLDEALLHLEAPGVTVNIQPGHLEVNGLPAKYDFGQ